MIGPVVVFGLFVVGLVLVGFVEDFFVGVAFDEGVVDFEEAGFEAAGAVGEAVSAGESLVEEFLSFFEVSWVVDAVANRWLALDWLGWLFFHAPNDRGSVP